MSQGSSELSMLALHTRLFYKLACISNSFGDLVPEEDADFSSISKYI